MRVGSRLPKGLRTCTVGQMGCTKHYGQLGMFCTILVVVYYARQDLQVVYALVVGTLVLQVLTSRTLIIFPSHDTIRSARTSKYIDPAWIY